MNIIVGILGGLFGGCVIGLLGFNVGLGNRFKLGDRIEFLPGLSYNTDSELITISTGFAIKL